MSCHDGTVALGATYNSGTVTNAVRVPLSSAGNLGVDLSRSHPFAFEQWNKNASLVDSLFNATARATANPKVKLSDGRIECVTCHEPHVQDIDPMRPTDFLVADNRRGAICLACHDANKPSPAVLAGWQSSAHAVSTSREGANVTGYPTVGDGACGNCHVEHRSGSARLLRAAEEQTCYSCHANPNSNYRWGRAWLGYDQKNYRHPIQVEGHEPNENLLSAGTPRHSKCWDCHNSHAALDNGKSAPNSLGSALVGADGMRSDGTAITPATAEYQVCLKCHGDSNNKPQKAGFADYGYTPVRSVSAFNVRRDFNSEIARHNVIHPFSGAAYPDLRDNILMLNGAAGRPLKTSGSFLKCSDCHNGDDPSSDGGSGPNGPHMSSNPHLLERPYALNEAPNPGQPVRSLIVTLNPRTGTFALCEKCHDVAGLLGNGTTAGPRDSVFKHHGSHVLNMGISCSVCHSPHGVDNGTQQFNAHSINLDTQLTGPDPGTQKWYIDTITRTCYVKCHFTNDQGIPVVHSGVSYALMASTPQVRPLKPAPRK
jgi:predicted CXXCH cytochrome family protein